MKNKSGETSRRQNNNNNKKDKKDENNREKIKQEDKTKSLKANYQKHQAESQVDKIIQ